MYSLPSAGFLCQQTEDQTEEILLQTISWLASRVFYIDWASQLLTLSTPDGKISMETLYTLSMQVVKDVRESRGI